MSLAIVEQIVIFRMKLRIQIKPKAEQMKEEKEEEQGKAYIFGW